MGQDAVSNLSKSPIVAWERLSISSEPTHTETGCCQKALCKIEVVMPSLMLERKIGGITILSSSRPAIRHGRMLFLSEPRLLETL